MEYSSALKEGQVIHNPLYLALQDLKATSATVIQGRERHQQNNVLESTVKYVPAHSDRNAQKGYMFAKSRKYFDWSSLL